ncbi:MAG: glycerophosphodiester phosphodiesterase [candidate division WOR-3 bacterium]
MDLKLIRFYLKARLHKAANYIRRGIHQLFKDHRLPPTVMSLAPYLRLGICITSIVAILANVMAVIVLLTFESEAAGFIGGGDPVQFYKQLRADLMEDYQGVFGIAHNSGNKINTTIQALAYGADIIEIDVVLVQGQLHAAHWSPLRFIGDRLFRGPRLEEVWGSATQAEVIKLDLKRASREMINHLLAFLQGVRRLPAEIVVVSDRPEALALLSQHEPRVIRMLSISQKSVLRRVLDDEALSETIDGVSINHNLLTTSSVASLKEKGLIVFAWTINDTSRMNQLVEYGVDGIVTDNLAILQLLGAQERGERTLRGRANP